MEKNQAKILGCVASDFTFSHEMYGEKFYKVFINVERESGTYDKLPIMISERLMDVGQNYTGEYMYVEGQLRTYNQADGDKKHLMLSLFALDAFITDSMEPINHIYLEGAICNHPTLRDTPLGRKISDVMLAVNRPYGKSDYIPCICWGRSANVPYAIGQGGHIAIHGRFQSREYNKVIGEETEVRTAYEVSVVKLEVTHERRVS